MYDDNVLFPLALNPENVSTVFIPESKGSSEVSQIPQFPRNHLRLIEKLGEGGFGMVRRTRGREGRREGGRQNFFER